MALYRQGKAAMDANGIVTGNGTNWQSALTLIRPGATILFLSSPIQMAVVNKVVSDTQINAITTNGAVVPSSDYAILLSDSLTVDGLAQDVAETLRYYQSQEAVIAEAVDFFKDFDFQSLKDLADQVKADAQASATNAAAAEASKNAAASSQAAAALSQAAAAASQSEAEATRDEIQQIIDDAGEQSTLVTLAQPDGTKKVGGLNQNLRQQWSNQLSGAGLHLVSGSFEEGAILNAASDAVWSVMNAKAYIYAGSLPKNITAGTNPASDANFISADINSNGAQLRFAAFGVKGDGSDDTAAVIRAANTANALGAKLVAEYKSTIKISGSTSIHFQYGVDWNYSVIKHDNFTGKIYIENPPELLPSTLDYNSAEITALRTNGAQLWGGLIPAWATMTHLKNYYLEIFTNVDFYNYRGNIYKRTDRTRLFRFGALADDFYYPIDPNTITSIKLYPVPDHRTYFENATFYRATDPKDLIVLTRSRTTVKNIHFKHDGGQVTTGMIWMNCNNFFDLEVDNVTVPFCQQYLSNPSDPTSALATYVFRMGDAYGLKLKNLQADGLEWGAIGTDEITNVEIYNCKLSRYDSHRPARGYIKVRDSHIGARGMSLQGAGVTLNCDSVDFLNNSVNYGNPGLPFFINTRGDAGGFFDGDLVTDKCTFTNNLTSTVHVVALTFGPDFSNGVPAGSPIKNVGFRTITHRDPIVKTVPGNDASRVDFGIREAITGSAGTPTASNTSDLPFNITLNGIKSRDGGLAGFSIICTRPASESRATSITSATTNAIEMTTNIELNINDCVLWDKDVAITLVDTTGTYSARVNLDNYRAMSDIFAVTMRLFMPAIVKAVNSRLREFRPFYNSATLDKPMRFEFTTCDIYPPDAFISWSTTATNRSASLTGCSILADAMMTLTKMAAYKLSACTYHLKGTGKVQVPITDDLSNTGATQYNFLAANWLSDENTYWLDCVEGRIPLIIPAKGAARYLVTGYSESPTATKYLKFYRNTGGDAILLTRNGSVPNMLYLP